MHDIAFLVGCGLIAAGCFLIAIPLGLIVAGLLAVAVALVHARQSEKAAEKAPGEAG